MQVASLRLLGQGEGGERGGSDHHRFSDCVVLFGGRGLIGV